LIYISFIKDFKLFKAELSSGKFKAIDNVLGAILVLSYTCFKKFDLINFLNKSWFSKSLEKINFSPIVTYYFWLYLKFKPLKFFVPSIKKYFDKFWLNVYTFIKIN
jgi:hypothetical protein